MNEDGKKWPAVPQVPLIGSDGVRAAADEIVGSLRSYRRPQPTEEFVVGSAAVIETSTGPGRPVPMLIGGDDFPFPDSRPVAGPRSTGDG